MFDTHCHLNFSRFKKNLPEVIMRAQEAQVERILIPGTDIASSKRAIEIARQYDGVYASAGIHPHHAFEITTEPETLTNTIGAIEQLLSDPACLAVGEIGIDRHEYRETKYQNYTISDEFLKTQHELFTHQIQLAIKHHKSLIIHNREATEDVIDLLEETWDEKLRGRTVFHCCEPDETILAAAQKYGIFIGVDGDVTYSIFKQDFIQRVPLDMLVLETDAPFLLPEPMRTRKEYPNEPQHVLTIAQFVSTLHKKPLADIQKQTTENALKLFNLS